MHKPRCCHRTAQSLQPQTLQRKPRWSQRTAAQEHEVEGQVDASAPANAINPLFAGNPQFAAAFSEAVTRQGDEVVYSGAAAAQPEE